MRPTSAALPAAVIALFIAASAPAQSGGALESATVTAAINKVSLVDAGSTLRPASVGDLLRGRTALETGPKSRAELVFNDRSIARLGANSLFAFSRGTRDVELNRGVILMQVPKGAGGATVQTAAVTAAVTGTTIFVEYSPADPPSPGTIKIFVLEGTLRATLRGVPGESMLLEAGQMIVMNADANRLPEAQVFDIGRMVQTSGLLSDQFSEIPSNGIILENIVLQNADKHRGRLIMSNFTLHAKPPGGMQNFSANTQNTTLRTIANQNPNPPKPPPPPPPKPPPPPPPTPPPTPAPTPYSPYPGPGPYP
jgi:hypothetical protein